MTNIKLILILFTGFTIIDFIFPPDVKAKVSASTDQNAYQFFNDNGNQATSTTRAAINTPILDVTTSEILRLRFEVEEVNGASVTVQGRIEFSSDAISCTTGTWTAMDTSTTAWRITASTQETNGTATTNRISGSGLTFDNGFWYDTQNEDTTGQALLSEHTEWEWAFSGPGAIGSTQYRFRVTGKGGSGVVLDTYTNCATLTTAAANPTYTQNHYQWYVDNDSENVTDIWGNPDLAEDTAITIVPAGNDPPDTTQELRLRANITVNTATITANSKYFKLQHRTGTDSDCSTGSWTDVGSGVWTYATSGVTDDTTLTVAKLTGTDRLETYSKSAPANTPTATSATGEDIEFDFHIIGSTAATATRYLFRVVETTSDSTGTTALAAWTNCPVLYTEPGTDNLLRHGNVFSEGLERGFFWAN